ncbi:MAG: DUF748 domain-containing protein [Candidatus Omnitrophota bacterium]
MKKILIILFIIFVAAAAVVYYFRYDIFQVSAEAIIKKNLPPFVHVDRIIFNLKDGLLEVKGFSLRNPRGYINKDLAKIDSITCRYKMKGDNILDGLEVTGIEASRPLINIERLPDGRFNINEMDKVMKEGEKAAPRKEKAPTAGKRSSKRDISDFVKLTNTIDIKSGKIVFLDKAVRPSPTVLTFEDVNGKVVLGLADDYRSVNSMESQGEGDINGDSSQRVRWVVSLDPDTERLTMSNRYEVSGVDITQFKPYYDRYSPIDIKRGWCSGTFVFDFDNGNIGSMNTLRLRGLKFAVKEDASSSGFWEAAVPDIIQYLRSSSGEIVFDFKIKGDMNSPRFYPGPILTKAIQAKVVDTITEALSKKGEEGGAPSGERSDAEKVVDILRGLLKE